MYWQWDTSLSFVNTSNLFPIQSRIHPLGVWVFLLSTIPHSQCMNERQGHLLIWDGLGSSPDALSSKSRTRSYVGRDKQQSNCDTRSEFTSWSQFILVNPRRDANATTIKSFMFWTRGRITAYRIRAWYISTDGCDGGCCEIYSVHTPRTIVVLICPMHELMSYNQGWARNVTNHIVWISKVSDTCVLGSTS